MIKGICLLCVMNSSYIFRELINLRSCYPFLENSIPFSHRKSCFESERYSSIKIKSIAHSENIMPYFIYSASVNIYKFSFNIFSHSDIIWFFFYCNNKYDANSLWLGSGKACQTPYFHFCYNGLKLIEYDKVIFEIFLL